MTIDRLKIEVAKEVLSRDLDRMKDDGNLETKAMAAVINCLSAIWGEEPLNVYQSIAASCLIMAAKYPTLTGRILETIPLDEHKAVEPIIDAIAELYEERR